MRVNSAPLNAAAAAFARRPAWQVLADWRGYGTIVPPGWGSFEYGTEGWTPTGTTGTPPTLAQSSSQQYEGVFSLLVTWGTATFFPSAAALSVTPPILGVPITVTARVYVPTGGRDVTLVQGGGTIGAASQSTIRDAWQQISVSFTPTGPVGLQVWPATQPTGGEQVYIDDITWEYDPGTYEDLSDVVDSVSIDRGITSYLPLASRIVSGFTAGQTNVSLVGDFPSDGGQVSRLLSPFTNVIAGRLQRLLRVRMGFLGSAGRETLPMFTGKVRDVQSSSDRSASLSAIDATEILNRKVTLPIAYRTDPGGDGGGPWVSPQWCADQVWRQNGYVWRTPPDRPAQAGTSGVVLAMTMEGSAAPHVGYIDPTYSFGVFASANSRGPVVLGDPDGLGLGLEQRGTTLASYTMTGATVLDASGILVEFYRFRNVTRPTSGLFDLFTLGEDGGSNQFTLSVNSAGQLIASLARAGGSASTAAGALGTIPTTSCYFAVHLQFNSAGVVINVRVNATTTSSTMTGFTPPTNTAPRFIFGQFNAAGGSPLAYFGNTSVSNEAFSSTMWRDSSLYALIPTVVSDSWVGEMTGTPPVADEFAWDVLQELAEAEQGAIVMLEDGTIRFYAQTSLNLDPQVNLVADDVIDGSRALKSAAASEAVDTVRNVVKVPATSYVVPVNDVLWSLGETIQLGAGQSRVFPVQLPGPLVGAYPGVLNSGGTVSGTAYPNSDGTGVAQSLVWSWTPTGPSTGYITISNPTGAAYFVVNSAGSPNLTLTGRCIVPSDSPYLSTASDAASRGTYGDQILDVPANRFRQTAPAADGLSALLLSRLAYPRRQIANLPVVGDPRRQLLDLYSVLDVGGLGLARNFMVTRLQTTLDRAGGISQTIDAIEVGPATNGLGDRLVWDATDRTAWWDSDRTWAT